MSKPIEIDELGNLLNSRQQLDPVGRDTSRGVTSQNQQLDPGESMPYRPGNDLTDMLDCTVESIGPVGQAAGDMITPVDWDAANRNSFHSGSEHGSDAPDITRSPSRGLQPSYSDINDDLPRHPSTGRFVRRG